MPENDTFQEIHTSLVRQAKRDMVDPGHHSEEWLAGYSEGAEHALVMLETLGSTTVDDRDEFLALPVGAVVRSAEGTIAARYDSGIGVLFGDERAILWSSLALPVAVLYMPPQTPEVTQ